MPLNERLPIPPSECASIDAARGLQHGQLWRTVALYFI